MKKIIILLLLTIGAKSQNAFVSTRNIIFGVNGTPTVTQRFVQNVTPFRVVDETKDTIYWNIYSTIISMRPLANNATTVLPTSSDRIVISRGSGTGTLLPTTLSGLASALGVSTSINPTITGINQTTVSGSFPNFTISSTQTLQSIPDITLTSSGYTIGAINGNTVAIPIPSVVGTGVGISTVTNSGMNFTVGTQAQEPSITGQTLSLSGTSVIAIIPSQTVQIIPNPTLSINDNTLSIVGANSVTLPVYSQTVQPVTLSISGNSISAGTNTIMIPTQTTQVIPPTTLSIIGNDLSTIGGNTITIPIVSQTTQIVNLVLSSNSLSAGFNTIVIPTQTVAESQSLVAVSNTISIKTGTTTINTVTVPIGSTPAFSTPSRVISTTGTNNTFVISSTKNTRVYYTINFSVALITLSSNGQIDLDYSFDGTTWIPISSVSKVYGLETLTNNENKVLSGEIPAGAIVRINRTQNTNTTITLTNKQQEIQYN